MRLGCALFLMPWSNKKRFLLLNDDYQCQEPGKRRKRCLALNPHSSFTKQRLSPIDSYKTQPLFMTISMPRSTVRSSSISRCLHPAKFWKQTTMKNKKWKWTIPTAPLNLNAENRKQWKAEQPRLLRSKSQRHPSEYLSERLRPKKRTSAKVRAEIHARTKDVAFASILNLRLEKS